MAGSGITVGSTYIDIPVAIGNQPLSKDHSMFTASSCHAQTTDSRLQKDNTPPFAPYGHGATSSTPPLTTAPNMGHLTAPTEKRGHHRQNLVTGVDSAYPTGLGHHHQEFDPREGHFMDLNDPSQLTTPVPINFGNETPRQFDNFQPRRQPAYEPETTQCDEQTPTYDELFPEGGPSN